MSHSLNRITKIIIGFFHLEYFYKILLKIIRNNILLVLLKPTINSQNSITLTYFPPLKTENTLSPQSPFCKYIKQNGLNKQLMEIFLKT